MNNYLVESDIELASIEWLQDAGGDLDNRNRDFHLKLSKGIDIAWKDDLGKEHFDHLYCVDYENPLNNDFLAVNQFTVEGKNNRRPDLMLFINGIPLVLFEFKNLFDTEATVENAYNQIQHYIEDIPQIFENNAITVISDGQTTLHGMFSSDMEWFGAWKSIDGLKIVEEDFALETLIKGLLTPERLLQYIRFYIFHALEGSKLIKKGAKYHQFFGIQYALKETSTSIKPIGNGRIGVIWHTTRSGKSITMAIYSAILRQMPELKNPTIVVQVDRFDLDWQLFGDFVEAKDLVGDIKRADSADDLRELLGGDAGGVIFSTIEKFRLKDTEEGKEESHPVLSNRENVIVIADECHRTQYGLIEGFAGADDRVQEVAVIMTSNISKDPKEWNPHIRTKEAMEAVKGRFKDPDDPLKIVIVRDMWLTGFDNPCLHTLYVDKIMTGHNLIQSINRVSTIFREKPSGLIVDYIGIGERLKLVCKSVNHIVKDDDPCKAFILNEKKLSALAPIVKTYDSIALISLDIIFYQHVGAAVRKIKFPVTTIHQKEEKIKELIHRSIESEAVIDVFEMAGIPKFDISIINDDFLESAKKQKSGTEIKLELIRQIINNEIKVRQHKNLIKYKKLKEAVERIIKDYHQHFFDSLIALQKMREVARDMQEEDTLRKTLGLNDEEEAFYEILAQHKTAITDFKLIKEIVKNVTAAIKKNLQTDWFKKPDARAQIMLAVKKVLRNKVEGNELQIILTEIMEQADARYRELVA